MLAPSRGARALGRAISSRGSAITLPGFLVPAFQSTSSSPSFSSSSWSSSSSTTPRGQRRQFSCTPARASKLGRTPISIPPGVELVLGEPIVKNDPTSYLVVKKRIATVTGPLGKLELDIPEYLTVSIDPDTRKAVMSIADRSVKEQKQMWGTTWAILQQHIIGVSEGHTAVLRLVGVGYRAMIEERPKKEEYPGQKFVCLKLGFTHPVEEPVPQGMKATTPQPTRILLEGIDRAQIMSFAAKIRLWRRPEPYKGKGIFVNDETIKLKQKKIK
ncbi:ribosomal protein L6 [Biscogniauxia mediterranea]|nr:ribosomal protein L6 [Biscogniauxia mediterranea]